MDVNECTQILLKHNCIYILHIHVPIPNSNYDL